MFVESGTIAIIIVVSLIAGATVSEVARIYFQNKFKKPFKEQ